MWPLTVLGNDVEHEDVKQGTKSSNNSNKKSRKIR